MFMLKTRYFLANLYHCCIHKSGSQWIPQLFSDPVVLKRSGLPVHRYEARLPQGYDPRRITERTFVHPFPRGTVVSPIYIDFPCFERIPKPRRYRAFYIMRDPRDVVVSYYFSWKTSHAGGSEEMLALRRRLNAIPMEEGLMATMESLAEGRNFDGLRSWRDAALRDPAARVFRFEDLIGTRQQETFRALFNHCRVRLTDAELAGLLDRHSFERLSGHKPGVADEKSHYRKGVSGDWRNYFSVRVSRRLTELAGDLVPYLGYPA
jgi:hypothetical protein